MNDPHEPDEELLDGETGSESETVEADDEAGLSAAGDVEDEEGEEGSEPEVDGDEPPARRPNRAQSRIQTLARETREARERADKVERELAELRAERARRDTQETAQQRAERRALMSTEDILREDMRESEQRTQGMLQQMAARQRDADDKRGYDAILRDDPKLARYDAEVERIRKDQEAQGSFVPREVILDLAIGRAARAAAKSGGNKKQVKAAAARVYRQTVRPGSAARGDVASTRGRQGDSLEKRLDGVII